MVYACFSLLFVYYFQDALDYVISGYLLFLTTLNTVQSIQVLRNKTTFINLAFWCNLFVICTGLAIYIIDRRMPEYQGVILLFLYPMVNLVFAPIQWRVNRKTARALSANMASEVF